MLLLQVSGLLVVVVVASALPVSYVPGPQQLQQLQHAQPQPQQQYQLAQGQQPQYQLAQPQQQQYQPQPQQYQPQPQQYQVAQQAGPAYQPAPQQQQQQQLAKLRPGGPLRGQPLQPEPEDYDPNPQYQFSFDVKDDQFTNYQNRKESREGDKISGSYSVVDSDGFIRTVKYTADPLEGFKAEVIREPTNIVIKLPQPPQPQPSGPGGALSARQQATQQYLQANGPPQPQSQLFTTLVHPQSLPKPQRLPNVQAAQQQYALPPSGPQQYQAPKVAAQQPGGGNVVYQPYQQ